LTLTAPSIEAPDRIGEDGAQECPLSLDAPP